MKRIFSGIGVIITHNIEMDRNDYSGSIKIDIRTGEIFLLLFGLVVRVFLAFVRAGTP